MLEYHVLAGAAVHAADLKNYQKQLVKVRMLNGDNLVIFKRDGAVFVNNGKVATANPDATNGVVHIIDRVLIPY